MTIDTSSQATFTLTPLNSVAPLASASIIHDGTGNPSFYAGTGVQDYDVAITSDAPNLQGGHCTGYSVVHVRGAGSSLPEYITFGGVSIELLIILMGKHSYHDGQGPDVNPHTPPADGGGGTKGYMDEPDTGLDNYLRDLPDDSIFNTGKPAGNPEGGKTTGDK